MSLFRPARRWIARQVCKIACPIARLVGWAVRRACAAQLRLLSSTPGYAIAFGSVATEVLVKLGAPATVLTVVAGAATLFAAASRSNSVVVPYSADQEVWS